MITDNITHFPTKDDIIYHNDKAKKIYQNEIAGRIYSFMHSGEETMNISEYSFEDTWVFGLVMGMCGKRLFETGAGVAYGRSDGTSEASIVIINKNVRLHRLKSELAKLSDKLINIKDTKSSNYQKTLEKIENLKTSISNIENSIKVTF